MKLPFSLASWQTKRLDYSRLSLPDAVARKKAIQQAQSQPNYNDLSTEIKPLPDSVLTLEEWRKKNAPFAIASPMGEHHNVAWEWIRNLKAGEKPASLLACWPRGGGKSTTVETGAGFVCTQASRQFVLYVSCTQDAANRHVQAVASTLERIGVERAVNKFGFSRGWRADMIRTSNGFNVLAFGLDAGARGVKLDHLRPDWIILDDIDELGDTALAVDKKVETITQTVLPTGGPTCAISFFQNTIHGNSVMARVLSGDLPILLNRIVSGPVQAIEGLKYEDVTDEAGNRRFVITAGTPSWEHKSVAVCEAEINEFGIVAFLRECQHDVGVGGRFFPEFKAQDEHGEDWHVCDSFTVPDWWEVWASHDYGTHSPACSLVMAADEVGDVYVIGETYNSGLASSEQCQRLLDLTGRLGVGKPVNQKNPDGHWFTRLKLIAMDWAHTFPPENPAERIGEYPVEVWWSRGLPVIRAVKDRIAGWRTMREWLIKTRVVDGKRRPCFRIMRGVAPNLERQLVGAVTNPRNPEELDTGYRDDHALDTCRYGLMVRSGSSEEPESMTEWGKRIRDAEREEREGKVLL